MGALLNAILGIGSLLFSVFSYLIFMIESTLQMVVTALTVIQGLPSFIFFLPAAGLALIASAFGIHILRTFFGR